MFWLSENQFASGVFTLYAACTKPISGAVDICFLSDTPIEEWIKIFTQYSIPVEEGPIAKTGATGPLCSIYVRDPDGNLIEVANLTS